MPSHRFWIVLLCVASCLLGSGCDTSSKQVLTHQTPEQAYHAHQSGAWVQGQGEVIALLPDDVIGTKHQRFILMLESKQTLLVSHNLDVAPRLAAIKIGDTVFFKGKYEWNAQGGVVHWTHHDPEHVQQGGWLRYQDRIFE